MQAVAGVDSAGDADTPLPPAAMPEVVDQVALARLYGEPLFALPQDLYIPPDALEVFLEAFEGPLDLLLYLIRKQNFNILDIPMVGVTRQYLAYVDEIRSRNLELAAEYLLMAAMLIEIKSRMLLPPKKQEGAEEAEDPRAELVRRLLEYEQMKLAAQQLGNLPQYDIAFGVAEVVVVSLEVINVDDDQRQRAAVAGAASPFVFQCHIVAAAIGDFGQAVDHRQFFQQVSLVHR